ncbi:MAG: hypothetical protein QGG36_19155, partial [Pirellulaceae bacterium]|nr:hypothetical protein [Pirellulaceae bacterium]
MNCRAVTYSFSRTFVLCFVALAWLAAAPMPIFGQPATGSGRGSMFSAPSIMGQQQGGILWVLDAESQQLGAYFSNTGRDIKFVGVRQVYYDLRPDAGLSESGRQILNGAAAGAKGDVDVANIANDVDRERDAGNISAGEAA